MECDDVFSPEIVSVDSDVIVAETVSVPVAPSVLVAVMETDDELLVVSVGEVVGDATGVEDSDTNGEGEGDQLDDFKFDAEGLAESD